jgi:glutathione synthase/RimK-type ligase-like ATP-grasp enzyme
VKRLVGIYRERECSPGRHQSNDALLLERVAERLRERDVAVDLHALDDLAARPPDAALIFSMCQGRPGLERLARWERAGAMIVNSPRAARNTYRDRLPDLMTRAGVPFPPTELVPTSLDGARGREAARRMDGGFWLKRGDVHASVAADVQWIESAASLDAARAEFASRGVRIAAIQAHRAGDELKFYAVGGFFHWFYTGGERRYDFDPAELSRLAARAAQAAGLAVFGGDVIVSPDGGLTIIDLNDWPSFAPCREAAAEAIADYLMRRVHVAWNAGVVSSANESAV